MSIWPRSIRWQMILSLVLLEIFSVALFAVVLMQRESVNLHVRADERLIYESSLLAMQAREAIVQNRPGWVELSVIMIAEAPTVSRARVTDPYGNVLFSSPGEPGDNKLTVAELAQLANLKHDEPHVFTYGKNRQEAIRPIFTGTDLRGYACVEYSHVWARTLEQTILKSILIFGCIWVVSSAVLLLAMFSSISRPLRVLHRGTRQLMRAPHSAAGFPLPVETHNELGELIEAFNGMVASIEEQRAGLSDTLSLLDSMLANAPIGFAFFDRNCRFVRVNQVFAGLTGEPTSRHIGRTLHELLPPQVATQLEAAVLRIFIEQEAVRNLEFNGEDATSGRLWSWMASAYPVLTTPRAVRWAGVIILDATDRKRAEDALRKAEKLAVTGRLAASIAHEINNPLEAITNLLFLLSNYCELAEPARNYVTMAEHEVRRIAEITQQTLRFYRQSTLPGPVRLGDLIDSVLRLYQGRVNAANLQLERSYDAEVVLNCFSGEIRQVLANLVGNAVDACATGGRIAVRARRSRDWNAPLRCGVRFTVADSGSGMDPEVYLRAFEPFFTTKDVTGTGLGLWISQEIVEKHHGTIRFRSRVATPGRPSGTLFTFFIPDRLPADADAAP